MPRTKLAKTIVEAAPAGGRDYELRDALTPGFLLKVTPAGGKIFMLAYTNVQGRRRKPAIGRYGELTVEQARAVARDWLADVRRGEDPSAERTQARLAPDMEGLCERFMREYSEPRNRASTVRGNRERIRAHILPRFGPMKVQDVTRPHIADLIGSMQATPTAANNLLSLLRKMFNLAEVWGYRPDGSTPAGMCHAIRSDLEPASSPTRRCVACSPTWIRPNVRAWSTRSSCWRSGFSSPSPRASQISSACAGNGSTSGAEGWPGPTARRAACPSP